MTLTVDAAAHNPAEKGNARMDMNLKGRVVIVTGANRGIGRAIAESAAGEGAIVAILARDAAASAETVEALGADKAFAVTCDVTDGQSIIRAVAEIEARHGRVDAVVNNAGRFGGGPIAVLGAAGAREGFETKVVGSLALVQAALPALRKSDQPRVVNVSGISAQRIMPGAAVTAMANASMITLTAYLARELIADRINVNCVIPGYILTDPWRRRTQDLADTEGLSFDEALVEVLKRVDMGHARWGASAEIADVVTFLLSGKAGFVNGAAFRIDGGQFMSIQG
jgi:NAD(P)-dependent dehydrogenase (short-subunit alcohol dehydrogenase family)